MPTIHNTFFIEKLFGQVPLRDVMILAIDYQIAGGRIRVAYYPRIYPEKAPAKWAGCRVAHVELGLLVCRGRPMTMSVPTLKDGAMRADISVEPAGEQVHFRIVGDVQLDVFCELVSVRSVTGSSVDPAVWP